ncbi:MAG: phage tail tip lysozyme [Lachnospira sp.]|nr:phage tail tip lysozyme [Lachnospira sp.]
MTEREVRNKIVGIFTGWNGRKESDGSHKYIIDLYNGHLPLARGYKVQYTDAWCATAASAAAIAAGYTDIIPTECSCEKMIALAKAMGIWVEDDSFVPDAADFILYDWQDNGIGDCTGAADHIGMVVSVSGGKIRVVEGNINDSVGFREIAVNGRNIRGFITPNYAALADSKDTPAPAASGNAPADNAAVIWGFLKEKGLNDFAIAGVMGNLYAESGLRPDNLQNSYEKKLNMSDAEYTAAVDAGTYDNFVKDSAGYGLAQWTYWSRKQALYEFIKQKGLSIGDLQGQLDFLYKELCGYTAVMNALKSAASVKAASDAVLTGYERPADMGDSVKAKRAEYGQNYFNKYASGSASTGGQTGAAATEQPSTTPAASSGTVYTVKGGDTLSKIAKAYNTSVDAILAANKGKYPKMTKDYIVVGWKLSIGGAAATTPAASSGTVYTVKSGDTLSEIAKAYNTSVDAILAANKGKYPKMTKDYIVVGWKLNV